MKSVDHLYENEKTIIACDEVGRGPLAGPVVACSVAVSAMTPSKYNILIDELSLLGVTDSKKLSKKKRDLILSSLGLSTEILNSRSIEHIVTLSHPIKFKIEEVSASEIDKLNILQASLACMKRSAAHLIKADNLQDGLCLIDGNKIFELGQLNSVAVVKGDLRSKMIGLASVIAKIYRDELMISLSEKYPGYGLERHAGYPTKFHKEAIAKNGPSPIHRKTFKGVKEFIRS